MPVFVDGWAWIVEQKSQIGKEAFLERKKARETDRHEENEWVTRLDYDDFVAEALPCARICWPCGIWAAQAKLPIMDHGSEFNHLQRLVVVVSLILVVGV